MSKKYPKYKLLKVRKDGLRRIKYTSNSIARNVEAGDLGGLLSGYRNLSQEGHCCVLEDARVVSKAHVCGNAVVSGKAIVKDDSLVSEHSRVKGNAIIEGRSCISGFVYIQGNAQVRDSKIFGNLDLDGDAKIIESSIATNATITGSASVIGSDFRMRGMFTITCGLWLNNPLIVTYKRFQVNEDGDGKIAIGCTSMSYDEWVEQAPALIKREGINPWEADELKAAVEFIRERSGIKQ